MSASSNDTAQTAHDEERDFDRLHSYSHAGTRIAQHRALHRLPWTRQTAFRFALPLGFTLLLLAGLEPLLRGWWALFSWWQPRLGLGNEVRFLERDWLGLLYYYIPTPVTAADPPSPRVLGIALAATLILMAASHLLLRRRWLPVVYVLWALGMFQLVAVGFFVWLPSLFPYTVAEHVGMGLDMGLTLMFLVPWLLALIYYPFGFGLARQIGTTALMVGWLALFLPHQYLVHAAVLQWGTTLWMPLLFIVFGVFLNVVLLIAIYSWAMSAPGR